MRSRLATASTFGALRALIRRLQASSRRLRYTHLLPFSQKMMMPFHFGAVMLLPRGRCGLVRFCEGMSGGGDVDARVWDEFFDKAGGELRLSELEAEFNRLWGFISMLKFDE